MHDQVQEMFYKHKWVMYVEDILERGYPLKN